MEKIGDTKALQDWLSGKDTAFACGLAARVALRVVPVMEIALHENEEERRRMVILPSFRALAAVNFAGACLGRAREVRNVARIAGQETGTIIKNFGYGARMGAIEAQEAIPEIHEEVWRLERDARELEVAKRAVNAVVEATQSVVAKVDAEKGIGCPTAVFDAVIAVVQFAHNAIDGIHGDTELSDGTEEDESPSEVPPHIAEFWNAVTLDIEWLEAGVDARKELEEVVAGLSEKALWLDGTPVWASRRWADFKDRLPEMEGWEVWVGWYEARLAGQRLDTKLETDLLNIAIEEWRRGPAHVNAIIMTLVASRSDPLLVAITHGFEDLDQVKQVSSIDLQQYSDRIRDALPNDPYQAIGATKDMLEATMKTILDHRENRETGRRSFSDLTIRCLRELKLSGDSCPATEGEKHVRKIANYAQRMITTANELRNLAGTGHGRVVGKEPIVTDADAVLVASTGLILAAWLLHHHADV